MTISVRGLTLSSSNPFNEPTWFKLKGTYMKRHQITAGLAALLLAAGVCLPAASAQTVNPATSARADSVVDPAINAEAAVSIMKRWQAKLQASGMSSAEVKEWTKSNMAKFATFTADQLNRAEKAAERWEIDLLLQSAPFARDTTLPFALAAGAGEIAKVGLNKDGSFSNAKNQQKLGLSTETREQLVFTPVAPCRIADSRPIFSGPGPLAATLVRNFNVVAGNTSYAYQGGSATSCGLAGIGGDDGAVLVLSLSTFGQAGGGFVTLFETGTTNPAPNAVSQWFQAGVVNTSTVFVTTDCCNQKDFSMYTSTTTDYAIDVVGYFARPKATALECVNTATNFSTINSGPLNGVFYSGVFAPACAAGYTSVSTTCYVNNASASSGGEFGGVGSGQCAGNSNVNTHTVHAARTCCRMPGR